MLNEHFRIYLNALESANLAEITEHSLRPDLKTLLSAIANSLDDKIKILHEGKREGKFGAPDFKVSRIENIIGYIENKKIGESLDPLLKSAQIKKYQQLSQNILLTNYLEWVLLTGKKPKRATLCSLAELETGHVQLDPQRLESVGSLIREFFSFAPEGIGKPKELAQALAIRGKLLKDFLSEELHRQQGHETHGKLFGLYQTFQKYVFHELTLDEFADAFSQNLIYGIFLAKLTADTHTITLSNADEFIPTNLELIRELVEFLKVLNRREYQDIRWVVEEVLTILNTMNLRDITEALSFTRTFSDNDDPYAAKDPYVYFYEDFLAAYDKKLRKAKGVYYTPPQVVNFIIRAVDDVLRETFHLPDGLADHERVTILDFATGTGTFLFEVIQQIFQKFPHDGEKQLLIRDHILKNLYGFEYLIAPYTVAHLKLSQYLKDNHYVLHDDERFQIFLTNTLEPTASQLHIPMLPALTEETRRAQHVKDNPILVIVGNPPYSGHSRNTGDWIQQKIQAYYQVDGQGLGEKNPKWLQDDYVKFIRFAQDKMDQVEEGIVAIITNHAFLDNPTFRGMRQNLLQTFDLLHFIDLHGSTKKKEKSPDGRKDENVFDIEPGVAISILVKRPGIKKQVYHSDFWGTRHDKFKKILQSSLATIDKALVTPVSPFYVFQRQNEELRSCYNQGMSIKDMFMLQNIGMFTARDHFTIKLTADEAWETIQKFLSMEDEDARRYFNLGEDVRDWKVKLARLDIQESGIDRNKIIPILYRPFDKRYTYYTGRSRGFHCMPRGKFMAHLIQPNVSFLVGRAGQNIDSSISWDLAYITDTIPDLNLFYRGGASILPVYFYEVPEKGLFTNPIQTENLTKEFRDALQSKYHVHYTAEQIAGALYALLYSPTYRAKYAEFLKIDFPRFLFPETREQFEQLSELGWSLIQAHLLKTSPEGYQIGEYRGEGNNGVIKPDYRRTQNSERLYINATQYFDHVPEDVYRFHIGGYQVLEKYLKDRKDRTLSLTEVRTIKSTIKSVAFTIEQMRKIDDATKDWI